MGGGSQLPIFNLILKITENEEITEENEEHVKFLPYLAEIEQKKNYHLIDWRRRVVARD